MQEVFHSPWSETKPGLTDWMWTVGVTPVTLPSARYYTVKQQLSRSQAHLVTKRSNTDERAAETLTTLMSGSPPYLRPGFNTGQHECEV